MKNLLKNFKENMKSQNEENKNLINTILESQREKEKNNNNEIFKNFK